MKPVLAATCLAAAFAVAGAGARTTGTQERQDRPESDRPISLTGCVRAGEQPGTFVLAVDRQQYERAMMQARGTGDLSRDDRRHGEMHQPGTVTGTTAAPGSVGTTGTVDQRRRDADEPGAPEPDRATEKVRLVPAGTHIHLEDTVNQRVRVTGRLEEPARNTEPAERDTAGTTAGVDHHGSTSAAGTTGTPATTRMGTGAREPEARNTRGREKPRLSVAVLEVISGDCAASLR
jgi:hypothetical protein